MDMSGIDIKIVDFGTTPEQQFNSVSKLKTICKTLHAVAMLGVQGIDVAVNGEVLSSFVGNRVVLGKDFTHIMSLYREDWRADPDMGDAAKLSYAGVLACDRVLKQLMPDKAYPPTGEMRYRVSYKDYPELYKILGGANG